ncbi:MAG: esterase [Burkholderiaceae bacterium]
MLDDDSLIIARPEGQAQQLILLFHGVGAAPDDLAPLGHLLASEFAQAFVVSVAAPDRIPGGAGRQWFGVAGIDEDSRVERVAAAMPAFAAAVESWRREAGVPTDAVALVGFSQGGIMALESTRGRPALAGRVVAIASRFARLPQAPNPDTTLHLFHGKLDAVIPYGFTVEAAQHLVAIGADVTADVVPFVGHQINEDIAALLIERLRGHVPRRVWDAAMNAARELREQETDPPGGADAPREGPHGAA